MPYIGTIKTYFWMSKQNYELLNRIVTSSAPAVQVWLQRSDLLFLDVKSLFSKKINSRLQNSMKFGRATIGSTKCRLYLQCRI